MRRSSTAQTIRHPSVPPTSSLGPAQRPSHALSQFRLKKGIISSVRGSSECTVGARPSNLDGRALTVHIDELFPSRLDGRAPTVHFDEPLTATQIDGLLPTVHIDELFPSSEMDELPQYTLTSPSLPLRLTGSCLQFTLTSSSPQLRWTSSYRSH